MLTHVTEDVSKQAFPINPSVSSINIRLIVALGQAQGGKDNGISLQLNHIHIGENSHCARQIN